MLRRRRPVAAVAAVGVVAHTAGKAGAAAAGADQAAQPAAEQQAAPVVAAPTPDDSMEELTKLKGLLDSGVLTQAEFDAQKQKILQTI